MWLLSAVLFLLPVVWLLLVIILVCVLFFAVSWEQYEYAIACRGHKFRPLIACTFHLYGTTTKQIQYVRSTSTREDQLTEALVLVLVPWYATIGLNYAFWEDLEIYSMPHTGSKMPPKSVMEEVLGILQNLFSIFYDSTVFRPTVRYSNTRT